MAIGKPAQGRGSIRSVGDPSCWKDYLELNEMYHRCKHLALLRLRAWAEVLMDGRGAAQLDVALRVLGKTVDGLGRWPRIRLVTRCHAQRFLDECGGTLLVSIRP